MPTLPSPRSGVSLSATIACLLLLLALMPRALRAEPLEWSRWPRLTGGGEVRGYDPVGNRALFWGGCCWTGETWSLSLGAEPVWTFVGEALPGRSGCRFALDAAANRLFVFGGSADGFPYQYTQNFWLEDAHWTAYNPTGSIPPGYIGDQRAAVYDATRNRFVLLGSQSYGNSYVFNPTTSVWTVKTNTGTVPIDAGPAIYDPVRDRFIVVTASGMCQVTPDTFVWTVISPDAHGTTVYDAARDRLVAVNGGDVWAMSMDDPPVWTMLSSSPPPVPNTTSIIHDTGADRLIVTAYDIWAYSLTTNTWSVILPGEGSTVETRYDHTSVIVRPWNAAVSYGMQFTGTSSVSKFMLDRSGLAAYTPGGQPPILRQRHAAIYDPVRGRMVIFGGDNGSGGYFNDVWAMYTGGSQIWSQLLPLGTLPAKRANVEAVYDPVRDRMLVFGGYDATSSYRDLWELTLPAPPTKPTWTRLFDNGTPEQMPALVPGSAAMVYDSRRDRVVALGTEQATSLLKAWACPLTGPPAWTQLSGSSSERVAFDAAYDSLNDRVLVFGGRNIAGSTITNDLTALSFPAETWSSLFVPNGPAGRYSHTFIHDGANGRFIVMGGREAGTSPTTEWYLIDKGAQLLDVPSGPPSSRLALASCRLVSADRVRIAAVLPEAGELKIEVFDVLGRRLGRTREIADGAGRHEFTVALERPASPGLYFVRAIQGSRSAHRKLVAAF